MHKNTERRVVVTGLGTINPLGNSVEDYWANLTRGKSGVRLSQHADLSDYKVKIAAEVDLPDITSYFPRQIIQDRFDRFIIFAHIAATQALKDSGLEVEKAPGRYGMVMGTGDAGATTQVNSVKKMLKSGLKRTSPYYIISHVPNTCASYTAKEFNLQGPNFTVNSACASSNHAMGVSATMIKSGMADAMLAGGTEAVLTEIIFSGFGNMAALSRRNDDPETASRPFDKDRDGFIMAEGASVVMLEEYEHAKKRGAKIYGELSGFAFSCDAYELASPDPEGTGAANAMNTALDMAGLNSDQIELVNAHAPSTKFGDRSESNAICKVFGSHSKDILVHSTKSMTGHLIGAAGTSELIAAILAFEKGIIHPTINQFEQDPEIPLNIVRNESIEKNVNHILSNSFGFGGQNACVIISKI